MIAFDAQPNQCGETGNGIRTRVSDVNLLQVHGGLLRRPDVKRFYERCGVL